jgi:RNA polymerase primary sigma factor
MKQKYEGKDLQGLVDLGREQGYLTFDQVNDYLPQDVASPTDLRAALDSFEDLDIKVLEEVPADGADTDIEVESKEEPEEAPEQPEAVGESSDPVRLYLKEMGNFQLLSREQEVEIAKRIEAGENEVEEEVLGSPITLDFVIDVGERVEAGEADLRDVFEEAASEAENADPDEERGPEVDERQRKKLELATKKLKDLRVKIDEIEEELHGKIGPRRKPKIEKNYDRLLDRVKKELRAMGLSRRLMDAVISHMRGLLYQHREGQALIDR